MFAHMFQSNAIPSAWATAPLDECLTEANLILSIFKSDLKIYRIHLSVIIGDMYRSIQKVTLSVGLSVSIKT